MERRKAARTRALASRYGFLPIAVVLGLLQSPGARGAAQGHDPSSDVPPGLVLVHGDILIPEEFAPLDGASCTGTGTYQPVTWTGGVVPFRFDASVGDAQRRNMLAAMDEWNGCGAAVAFVPVVGTGLPPQNFVTIQDSTANNSTIGSQLSSVININNWGVKSTLVHELCHTLGFWHEQSRPDRDLFVTIQCGNVCTSCCSGGSCGSNFAIESFWPTLATPYDYASVMHYDQCAFSTNVLCPVAGRTILTVDPTWQALIGNVGGPSLLDVQDMIDAYGSGPPPTYVDGAHTGGSTGELSAPHTTVAAAAAVAPAGGTVWMAGGTYDEGPLTLSTPGVWRPWVGAEVVVE